MLIEFNNTWHQIGKRQVTDIITAGVEVEVEAQAQVPQETLVGRPVDLPQQETLHTAPQAAVVQVSRDRLTKLAQTIIPMEMHQTRTLWLIFLLFTKNDLDLPKTNLEILRLKQVLMLIIVLTIRIIPIMTSHLLAALHLWWETTRVWQAHWRQIVQLLLVLVTRLFTINKKDLTSFRVTLI